MKKHTFSFLISTLIFIIMVSNLNAQVCDAGDDIEADYSNCITNGIEGFDLESLLPPPEENKSNSKKIFSKRWVYKDGPRGPRGKRVARIRNSRIADFPNTGAGPEEDYVFYYIETDDTCADTAIVNVCTALSVDYSFKEITLYYCEDEPIFNKDELLNAMPLDKIRDKDGYLKKESETDSIPIENYTFPITEGAYLYNDYSLNKTDVIVTKINCSTKQIEFSFDNAQNTNDGISDFFEVDVMIKGNTSFKLGNGKLYFKYNNEAFGEYIDAYETIEVSYPDGYILGQSINSDPNIKIYDEFETFDNTNGESTNRFSFKFNQKYGTFYFNSDNVEVTPKKLCHLKIKYQDVTKLPMLTFEYDGIYDNQFLEADRNSLIVNDSFDNSGATLSSKKMSILTNLIIYPNPTNSYLHIKGDLAEIKTLEVYSISGKKLIEVNNKFNKIDISYLQSSMYFVKVKSDNSSRTFKVIKE